MFVPTFDIVLDVCETIEYNRAFSITALFAVLLETKQTSTSYDTRVALWAILWPVYEGVEGRRGCLWSLERAVKRGGGPLCGPKRKRRLLGKLSV